MSDRAFRNFSTLAQKTITHRLREQLERRQRVRFWGRNYFVTLGSAIKSLATAGS